MVKTPGIRIDSGHPLATLKAARECALLVEKLTPSEAAADSVQSYYDCHRERLEHDAYTILEWAREVGLEQRVLGSAHSPAHVLADAVKSQLSAEFMLLRWLSHGMPVLAPTPDLAATLAMTSYKGVDVGELPLPFETFAVRMPEGWIPPPHDRTKVVWVHRFDSQDYRRVPVQVVRIEGAHDNPRFEPGADPGDYLNLHAGRGDIEQQIGEIASRNIKIPSPWNDAMEAKDASGPEERHRFMLFMVRVALGLAMYVSSPSTSGDRRRLRHKPPRKQRRKQDAARLPVEWVVGESIHLPAGLRAAAVDFQEESLRGRSAGWRVARWPPSTL